MILLVRTMIKADYEPRPIAFIDLWPVGDFRLKAYSIACNRPRARELIDAARHVISIHLDQRPTEQEHYGVGFAGIHEGRGENQVFLDLWVNQNELLHTYWVSPPSPIRSLVARAKITTQFACGFVPAVRRASGVDRMRHRQPRRDEMSKRTSRPDSTAKHENGRRAQ